MNLKNYQVGSSQILLHKKGVSVTNSRLFLFHIKLTTAKFFTFSKFDEFIIIVDPNSITLPLKVVIVDAYGGIILTIFVELL